MSRLFLMRHAQAGSAVPDSERALTELGCAQARSVGRILDRLRPAGSALSCSPARRCHETAALLGAGEPTVDPRLALDGPVGSLLELAREAPADGLLVGHQPELHALLAALLPGGAGLPFSLPPASLLGLQRTAGSAFLSFYLEPDEARDWDADGSER